MNGAEQCLASCLDLALGPNKLSNKDINKLRSFYMQQRELLQELSEAKPLGICKITGLGESQLQVLRADVTTGKRRNSKETL